MSENQLRVHAELIDDGVQFRCGAEDKPPLLVDYIPPYGRGAGHTSLELLLISLATCFASTLKLMLTNHVGASIDHVSAAAQGKRRADHPTTFESIELELRVDAPGLERHTLDAVVEQAKHTYCPVLASIHPDIPVHIGIQKSEA